MDFSFSYDFLFQESFTFLRIVPEFTIAHSLQRPFKLLYHIVPRRTGEPAHNNDGQ
jgi:hypothetical protein